MPTALIDAKCHIHPALVTPLLADGSLDVQGLERLVDHLYRQGVGGLYVTGSTGEGVYLEAEVRKKVVELSVNLSRGRGVVIAHVGATSSPMAYELARHAGQVGADAVASIPPFVGGFRWNEVHEYYRCLAQASPVPVVAYHFPGLVGQSFKVDELATLLDIPNVGGFKFTDMNFYLMQRLIARLKPGQVVYNGPDEMLALGLAMGAHGGIGTTYNFMGDLILKIDAAAKGGRLQDAVELQKQANEIIEILLSCHGVVATKQILYWQGLISTPTCVSPRAPLTEAEKTQLRKRLQETYLANTLVRE